MSEGTLREAPAIIGTYDFTQFSTLVDVGGGDGTLLASILASTPGLHGTLFDTGPGLAESGERLRAAGVDDRCDVVEGDFFESVPEGANAYIIKSVIHDWDDEKCVTILSNCRQAMNADGKVLILEPVVPEVVKPSFALLGVVMSDLNMLMNTGGKERTEEEFASPSFGRPGAQRRESRPEAVHDERDRGRRRELARLARRVDDGVGERNERLTVFEDGFEAGCGTPRELGVQSLGHRVAIGGVGEDRVDGDQERLRRLAVGQRAHLGPE
jgi:O-methyltransferase domain